MVKFYLVIFWQLGGSSCLQSPIIQIAPTWEAAQGFVRLQEDKHTQASLCADQVRTYRVWVGSGKVKVERGQESQVIDLDAKPLEYQAVLDEIGLKETSSSRTTNSARRELIERLEFEKLLDEAELTTIKRLLADPSIDEPLRGILEDDLIKKRNKNIDKAIKGLGGEK